MNSQPKSNSSTVGITKASTWIDEIVPTFGSSQGTPQRKKIDLTDLTEEYANFLRDPFTCHSIFTPTVQNAGAKEQVSSVLVTRQTRVSTECDSLKCLETHEGVEGA